MTITLDDVWCPTLEAAWIGDTAKARGGAMGGAAEGRAALESTLDTYRRVIADGGDTETSFVPPRFAGAEPEHPDVVAWLLEVSRNLLHPEPVRTGPSLLIIGNPGTGKTHQVYGCRRVMYRLGIPVSWSITTAAEMNAALRKFDQADANTFANAQLLVVDDLAAGKHTDFNDDNLYRIVNRRYEHMLPTIFTTNLDGEELEAKVGERIASRLGEMCTPVLLEGVDRRVETP